MSLEFLPDVPLDDHDELGARFRDIGVRDYRSAARYARDLPYGRNSDRSDYRLVLDEGRGTCSTKHGLLAALAREHGVGVELRIGVYFMDGSNTPGVGAVLRWYGIPGVPEAHCFLAYRGRRVDLTGVGGTSCIEEFLLEEAIEPEQIGPYKVRMHRAFVERWSREANLDSERAWLAREECIAALSGGGAA